MIKVVAAREYKETRDEAGSLVPAALSVQVEIKGRIYSVGGLPVFPDAASLLAHLESIEKQIVATEDRTESTDVLSWSRDDLLVSSEAEGF